MHRNCELRMLLPGNRYLMKNSICWLVGCFCLTSHRQRGHLETAPHLLSLAKDVKLDKYTVPTGN